MFEGVLAPGGDSYNIDLAWVLVTRYGREVLKAGPATSTTEADISGIFTKIVPPPDTVLA